MSKLLIHETDCHGCGIVSYEGKDYSYTYDDAQCGDIKLAVEFLTSGFFPGLPARSCSRCQRRFCRLPDSSSYPEELHI